MKVETHTLCHTTTVRLKYHGPAYNGAQAGEALGSSRYKLDIAENGMALETTSLCIDNPTSYFMKQRLQKTKTTTMVHKNNPVASFRRQACFSGLYLQFGDLRIIQGGDLHKRRRPCHAHFPSKCNQELFLRPIAAVLPSIGSIGALTSRCKITTPLNDEVAFCPANWIA